MIRTNNVRTNECNLYKRGATLRFCRQNKPVLHKAYKLKENKEKKLNAKTTHFSDRGCLHVGGMEVYLNSLQ